MLNILSYFGVSLQSELCIWTLVGLIRTIFDATLFKVNANLKEVWQMSMPELLSMPVQRVMRTIISGVMLVQCFTVYVYLASYIVLLYPVFLEERPALVLPWLLLAAIRNFLCELTSLALGLGACLLLGAARPPCIRFVVFKVASISPAFYMWLLVFSYYSTLKVASQFKRFTTPLTMMPSDHDYGLELAVRRRLTKSLQGEEHLRKKLVASLNGQREISATMPLSVPEAFKPEVTLRMIHSSHADFEDFNQSELFSSIMPITNDPITLEQGAYEDWCGNEVIVPRDGDRVLEQFSLMMLRIAACMQENGTSPSKLFTAHSDDMQSLKNMDCSTPTQGIAPDTSPLVSTQGKTASYLQNYPQIFMKKPSDNKQLQNESIFNLSQPPNVEVMEDNKIKLTELLPIDKSRAEKNLNEKYESTRHFEKEAISNIECKKSTDTIKKTENSIDTNKKIERNTDTIKQTEKSSDTNKQIEKNTDTNKKIAVLTQTQPTTSKMITQVKDNIASEKTQSLDSILSTKKCPTIHVDYDNKQNTMNSSSDSQIKKQLITKESKQLSEKKYNTSQITISSNEDCSTSVHTRANIDSFDAILKRIKNTLEEENNKKIKRQAHSNTTFKNNKHH